MKNFIRLIPIIILLSCNNSKSDKHVNAWVSLWNGKDLTGWHTYFASPFSGSDKTQSGFLGPDNPSQDIIKVVELEDGNARFEFQVLRGERCLPIKTMAIITSN